MVGKECHMNNFSKWLDKASGPINCMTWIDDNKLLFGSDDGHCYRYNQKSKNSLSQIVFKLKDVERPLP
eukprot:UN03423